MTINEEKLNKWIAQDNTLFESDRKAMERLRDKILAELSAQPERELEWRDNGDLSFTCYPWKLTRGTDELWWVHRFDADMQQFHVMARQLTLPVAKSLAAKLAAVLDGGDE